MKRTIGLILALALMLSALSVPAFAAETGSQKPLSEMTFEERVTQEASNAFKTAQINAQRESFHGYCGLFVGHLLYALKINKYFQANDGNRWYDYYVGRKTTTGGHNVVTYDSVDYTLTEALLAVTNNGERTARNILVGFEKTDTDAGQEYGHAVLINAIIGDKVYFVESFDMWIGGRSVPEGEVIKCSIEAFATYFDRWAEFEGIVHFGSGSLEEVSLMRNTNLWLMTRFDATIRTQPCLIGQNRCQLVRNVPAGERLRASGVYQGDRAMFYRVETEEGYGFIPAVSVIVEGINREDLTVEELRLPMSLEPGQTPPITGKVSTRLSTLASMELHIYNHEGKRVARNRMVCKDNAADMVQLAANQVFEKLHEGTYTVEVYATREYYLAEGMEIVFQKEVTQLYKNYLVVGTAGSPVSYLLTEPEKPGDGWQILDGKWYFYQDGTPKKGWLVVMDARYYMDDSGAAVTGWQYINNTLHYFSPEGALRKNEERTYGKNIYRLDENGTAVFKSEVPAKKKK